MLYVGKEISFSIVICSGISFYDRGVMMHAYVRIFKKFEAFFLECIDLTPFK